MRARNARRNGHAPQGAVRLRGRQPAAERAAQAQARRIGERARELPLQRRHRILRVRQRRPGRRRSAQGVVEGTGAVGDRIRRRPVSGQPARRDLGILAAAARRRSGPCVLQLAGRSAARRAGALIGVAAYKPPLRMRLYRIDGESQMTMSSNSPPLAPAGVGLWLMKTRSASRLNDSSLPAAPPVLPGTPFLPAEKITATALVVRVVLVP